MISSKLLHDDNFNSLLWTERIVSNGYYGFSFVLLLIFLTCLNWILEILKWKALVTTVKKLSFLESAKQSLASLTASLITPNRIGEYGAKAVYYSKIHRPKILLLNFLSNFNQMLVTVIFGLIGLLVLRKQYSLELMQTGTVLSILFIFAFAVFLMVHFRFRLPKKLQKVVKQAKEIPKKVHKNALLFSIGRYLVFSHQFYFLLLFFGIDLEYSTAMSLIFAMYLISSVIPGFVLFDWLVKGSVAVTLFGLFGIDEMIILSITACMWILNFAIPAAMGSYYVLTFNASSLVLSKNRLRK